MCEIRCDVQVIKVKRRCDACLVGFMVYEIPFNALADSNPFKHVCDICKTVNYYGKKYPYIEYKDGADYEN